MPVIPICRGFAGLNNTVDPARLRIDPENPIIDLAECVNMSFDETGRGSVRQGYTLLNAGDYHSVWSARGMAYVAEGTDLYRIVRVHSDYTVELVGLRNGLAGSRIDYCWTPLGVYYANGQDRGYIQESTSYAWTLPENQARPRSTRHYTGPPSYALHLGLFANRMFASEGNVLYYSQVNDYATFRKASDFYLLPDRITMVIPVAGGMYLADENKTYFAQGNDVTEFVRRTVMDCPAMEWSKTDDLVNPTDIGMEGSDGWACWVSKEGLVFGSPTGDIIEPTKAKIEPPSGFLEGAAVMNKHNCIYNFHQ